MYLKRKIDEFLLNWREDTLHKPLIIKGARQIGKTESTMSKEINTVGARIRECRKEMGYSQETQCYI